MSAHKIMWLTLEQRPHNYSSSRVPHYKTSSEGAELNWTELNWPCHHFLIENAIRTAERVHKIDQSFGPESERSIFRVFSFLFSLKLEFKKAISRWICTTLKIVLPWTQQMERALNPLNAELNPICYLLALLGAHHFLHVSRIRLKLLTFRLLMSYIYIYIYIYI